MVSAPAAPPLRRFARPITFDELKHYLVGKADEAYHADPPDRERFMDVILAYEHMIGFALDCYYACFAALHHTLENTTPEDMRNRVVYDIAERLEAALDHCADAEKEHAQRYRGHEEEIARYVDDLLEREQFR